MIRHEKGARRPQDWTQREPGLREFWADLRRLARKNRARPLALLLTVLLLSALGFYRGYVYQPSYRARITLRLTEVDVGVAAAPRPISALRGFIMDVALSDRFLIGLIERYGLYERLRARGGIDQAIKELREEVEIEVWRNEFLIEDPSDPIGRSARVSLSYAHRDPEVAFGVVKAMADAAVAEQRRMRRVQVEGLAAGLEPAILATQRQLQELKLKEAHQDLQDPVALSQGPMRRAEIEELERRLAGLIQQRGEAQLRLRAEDRDLGVRPEIIDVEHPQARPYHRRAMVLGALGGLLIGLLLGGIGVKSLDRRIYDEEDILHLGLPVCGTLPFYRGDDLGSMKSRVRIGAR